MKKSFKDFENLIKNVEPVMPSSDFKQRVLDGARKIPVLDAKPLNRFGLALKRYGALFAVLCLTLVSAITMLGFYGESYYEVYVDVNPSVEISVNRFGVVNDVKYLNDDAQKVFENVNLKGKKPEEAITDITLALNGGGYLKDKSEVFISGYSRTDADVDKIVEALYYRASDFSEEQGYNATILTGNFTDEERKEALKNSLSPLKYSIISELSSLDDEYTLENLSGISMGELNGMLNSLKSVLTDEVIRSASERNVSPMRYKLEEVLVKTGLWTSDMSLKTTAQLKEIFIEASDKKSEFIEKTIEEQAKAYNCSIEKFTLIYSIIERDPSYTVESLIERTMFELRTLDYALEKYDVLLDIFR